MKIDSGAAQQAYASAAYQNAAGPKLVAGQGSTTPDAAGLASAASSDSVQISAQSRVRAQALEAVKAAPDTRSKLVMELRSQIKAGTFTVDDNSLARHLASALQ